MADLAYRSAWQRIRPVILHRDGYQCQIQGPRCAGLATTVDHIDDVDTHGPAIPPLDRLRAACVPCNSGRGAAMGNAKRARKPSRQWL